MRKLYLVACLVVLYSVPALAQTGIPASWTLKIYQQGSAVALQTFSVTGAICNQAPLTNVPAPPVLNPDAWVWDDVVNLGRVCILNDGARLAALPDGNYEGTAQAVNADGTSPESVRVPFARRRPNPPAAPTGLRFGRQAQN